MARKSFDMFTDEELKAISKEAKKTIPSKVEYYSKIIGVSYNRIAIRSQVSRWGSCSSKKNLNFNCLLMLAPEKVMDYVIIHELCHLKQMNHSKTFWHEVEAIMPDYREQKKWLNEEGSNLITKLRKSRF